MQNPHRHLRVNKPPRALQHRIAPSMKIFRILGILFAMVPCLHQCKVYIKRKLRVWTAKNAISKSVQKPHRPVRVNKLPCVVQLLIAHAIEIFEISGLPIALVPILHQCNVYIVRKLRVWRVHKCNFLVSAKTAPTVTGQQTTPCLATPYRASNENFRNIGDTFRHGTVFAPMQCLY